MWPSMKLMVVFDSWILYHYLICTAVAYLIRIFVADWWSVPNFIIIVIIIIFISMYFYP